jgi:hypothetical protein
MTHYVITVSLTFVLIKSCDANGNFRNSAWEFMLLILTKFSESRVVFKVGGVIYRRLRRYLTLRRPYIYAHPIFLRFICS